MIADTITKQITDALKAKDEIRLSVLRMLLSALNYEFIAKQHKLTEEEEMMVVKKEAKKRKDAIEIYKKLKDEDNTNSKLNENLDRELAELEILKEYLPEEINEKELESIVNQTIKETGANSIKDMGKVIGLVMQKSKGGADGALVAQLAKKILS